MANIVLANFKTHYAAIEETGITEATLQNLFLSTQLMILERKGVIEEIQIDENKSITGMKVNKDPRQAISQPTPKVENKNPAIIKSLV